MARRRSWKSLPASQKKRYLGSGRTGSLSGVPMTPDQVRRYYESGGDLSAGRGHASTPKTASPKSVADRLSIGFGDDADRVTLRAWRTGEAYPTWLPRSTAALGDDTAAILSQIPYSPKYWKSVTIRPVEGTTNYILRVEPKGAASRRAREVLLPDYDSVKDVGTLLNNYSREKLGTAEDRARFARQWEKAGGKSLDIRVTIAGYGKTAKEAGGPLPNAPKGDGAFTKVEKSRAKPITKAKKKPITKAKKKPAKRAGLSLEDLNVADLISDAVADATKALQQQNKALEQRIAELEKLLEKGL